ncbi:MAG: TonB-dependent receptor [Pseudomonas sp.]
MSPLLHCRRTALSLHVASCLLLGGLAGTVQAQQSDTSAEKQATTLDAITITATKRATRVQDTPMAISAITAETLSEAGIVSVREAATKVPGLSVQDSGPGATRLSMRGIYSTGEATTSLYYDETPISGSVGTTNDAGGRSPELNFFDVERIEALRGPQGTLYGSGSMGGSLRIIFQKPKLDTTEGTVQAGYFATKGGEPSWSSDLMLNTPLVENVLALRLTASKSDQGGYVDNLRYGEKNVDYKNSESARLALRYQPTDTLTLDASVLSQSTDAILSNWSPGSGVDYGSMAGMNIGYESHTRISNLTVNWDLDWATLTASSSYFKSTSVYGVDATYLYENTYALYYSNASDYTPIQNYYPGTTRNWSNEIRLASNGGGRIDWTAGLFNENRKNDLYSQYVQGDASTGYVLEPHVISFQRHIDDQLKQNAAFGETTWHASDRLDLTAGLRYYRYDKTIAGYTDIPNKLTSSSSAATALSVVQAEESGWLKKGNASWRFSPTLMAYATVADGMRPGGANQNIPDIDDNLRSYKSDHLWNYEAGIKSEWFDRSLSVNVALYQIDWDNMQISATTNPATTGGSYSFLTNAGKARMRGTEWELVYRPLAGLDLGLNFNYLDAVLTEDQINNYVQSSSTLGKAGDRIPNIPHWNASLSAAYRWSLSGNLDGMLRLDGTYVGTAYTTLRPDDPSRARIGDYTLVNARFGVESASGKWATYLYVNNLTDRVAITTSPSSSLYYPYGNVFSTRPRSIGIDVKLNF